MKSAHKVTTFQRCKTSLFTFIYTAHVSLLFMLRIIFQNYYH